MASPAARISSASFVPEAVPLPVAGGPGATVVAGATAVVVVVAVAVGVVAVAVGVVAVAVGVVVVAVAVAVVVVAVAVVVVAVAVVVVAVAVVVVGLAVVGVASVTMTVPLITAAVCTSQKYGYVPGAVNVKANSWPVLRFGESQTSVVDRVEWRMPAVALVHVTVSPTLMFTVPGLNARPDTVTSSSAAPASPGERAMAARRSAMASAMLAPPSTVLLAVVFK
jgi:hypothetical protein